MLQAFGALKGWSRFAQGDNLTNEPFREYTKNPNQINNPVTCRRNYSARWSEKFQMKF